MMFAISHRCPDFDQVAVRIIEPYNFLSPAVCHESVHILDIGVIAFQLLDKTVYIGFFKIELAGIVFGNDLSAKKLRPVFSSCRTSPSERIMFPPLSRTGSRPNRS